MNEAKQVAVLFLRQVTTMVAFLRGYRMQERDRNRIPPYDGLICSILIMIIDLFTVSFDRKMLDCTT